MCPQLRHHESAKIRLEAQRQTQVNVSSVSFGEHKTGQFIVRLWLWRQSAMKVKRPDSSQLVCWLPANKKLVWIIKRTSYCAECYHDKIVCVFARLSGRHVSIIFSMEIIIFHYLPSRLATRERGRQSQTNLYLLRGAQCRAPLFEGDFVTTLHFIASNDQPRRQHWITSFPSCLWLALTGWLPTDQLSPSFLSALAEMRAEPWPGQRGRVRCVIFGKKSAL